MRRRDFLKRAMLGLLTCPHFTSAIHNSQYTKRRTTKSKFPQNFVLILMDDLGYGDLSCYGNTRFTTSNLDQMAKEGVRFTNFYACAPVCTPTRASIMTGCYPSRVGLSRVLGNNARTGINSKEITIAEVLKSSGYKTACYGKWHLGHLPPFLPTNHGFDEYYGLPYSNDMGPDEDEPNAPPLPLIEGTKVIEENPDQSKLTGEYTARAIDFIKRNRDNKFFLYLPHTMVHVPLYVSEKFRGKSGSGLYGDVMQEIDWSVGEILNTLKELCLDENTMVIFTSDNGPWLIYGNHAGSSGPLRCGKSTTFEGGMRVPCIAWAPRFIPAGKVCNEISATFDFYPTFAKLANAEYPKEDICDGKNIWNLLSCPNSSSPHRFFLYYLHEELQAIRNDKWKLHFPHKYQNLDIQGNDGKRGSYKEEKIDWSLFDLENDISEQINLASEHPKIVEMLKKQALKYDKELKSHTRPCGKV
ncbi:MAG: sulfatase [Candidatus Hydrogenedentes bacterium]|nr:sulfatase [Candidatus Hydrogenedentota bacterium]